MNIIRLAIAASISAAISLLFLSAAPAQATTTAAEKRVGSCMIMESGGFDAPELIVHEFCVKNRLAIRILTGRNIFENGEMADPQAYVVVNLHQYYSIPFRRNTEEVRIWLMGLMLYTSFEDTESPRGYKVEVWDRYMGPVAIATMGPVEDDLLPRTYEFPHETASLKRTVIHVNPGDKQASVEPKPATKPPARKSLRLEHKTLIPIAYERPKLELKNIEPPPKVRNSTRKLTRVYMTVRRNIVKYNGNRNAVMKYSRMTRYEYEQYLMLYPELAYLAASLCKC